MNKDQIDMAMESVFRRSITDSEFRRLCLSDGNAAIAATAGTGMPEGLRVRFIENTPGEMTVVLPNRIAETGEIADSELAEVSGGFGYQDIIDYFWGCDRTCRASAGSAVAPGRCNTHTPH